MGQGDRVNHLFARFDSHGTIALMEQDDAPDTFSYLVPTLPQGSLMLAASEGDEYSGPFAIAHADGLIGGDVNVKRSIPAPALPIPAHGRRRRRRPRRPSSNSSLAPATTARSSFISSAGDRPYYALYVVTAKTELTIPEVAGGAFDLDKVVDERSYSRRSVITHGDYDSVDAMLGPNGFFDVFGYRTGIPIGPHHTIGCYTTSAAYEFKTAP